MYCATVFMSTWWVHGGLLTDAFIYSPAKGECESDSTPSIQSETIKLKKISKIPNPKVSSIIPLAEKMAKLGIDEDTTLVQRRTCHQ